MSRPGLATARRTDRRLPQFPSKRAARSALFAARDRQLVRLQAWAALAGETGLNATPESLKRLEAWYFRLVAGRGFRALGTSREEFEDSLAVYFGRVVVATHGDARWVVAESPFVPGRFSLGVERGLCTWLGDFRDLFRAPKNKSRTRLFRDYRKYFTAA